MATVKIGNRNTVFQPTEANTTYLLAEGKLIDSGTSGVYQPAGLQNMTFEIQGRIKSNEAGIRLGEATGLNRDDVTSLRFVAPATRFAVDAYINFARQRPWQEAVASSLTELFAPHIHQQRLDTWPTHYPWVDTAGLQYFRNRLTQARRDVEHGLRFTLEYFSQSRAMQQRALDILQFKLDVLWAMADAIMLSQCEVAIVGPRKGAAR